MTRPTSSSITPSPALTATIQRICHQAGLHQRDRSPRQRRRSGASLALDREVAEGRPLPALRSEPGCLPTGDALDGLRSVSRRVLLRPQGNAFLPLEQRPEGGANRGVLRSIQILRWPPLFRLEAPEDWR